MFQSQLRRRNQPLHTTQLLLQLAGAPPLQLAGAKFPEAAKVIPTAVSGGSSTPASGGTSASTAKEPQDSAENSNQAPARSQPLTELVSSLALMQISLRFQWSCLSCI
jgi:hypothetical protein